MWQWMSTKRLDEYSKLGPPVQILFWFPQFIVGPEQTVTPPPSPHWSVNRSWYRNINPHNANSQIVNSNVLKCQCSRMSTSKMSIFNIFIQNATYCHIYILLWVYCTVLCIFLLGRTLAPLTSWLMVTADAASSFHSSSMTSKMFGCAFEAIYLKRLCHPSRRLLVRRPSKLK